MIDGRRSLASMPLRCEGTLHKYCAALGAEEGRVDVGALVVLLTAKEPVYMSPLASQIMNDMRGA
jgi:hypothetical protein